MFSGFNDGSFLHPRKCVQESTAAARPLLSSSPADPLPDPPSRLNVSRSGRVIRPPLEYWKGGRVILDAHMNVTIHECYDTSIHMPVST